MNQLGLRRVIFCAVLSVAIVLDVESRHQDRPVSIKLPFSVSEREPVDRSQRIGSPVFIRATHTVKVMADKTTFLRKRHNRECYY